MSSPPDLLDRPLVIVGSPRSGTTLLSELLQVHPDVVYLEEPRLVWRYGNDGKSDMLFPEDARPEVVQHIRDTFARHVAEGTGTRLLEKTPSNALRLGFVDRVLPECKFVHITRHGVESVLSIRKFWQQYAGAKVKGRIGRRLKELDFKRLPYYGKEALRTLLPGKLAKIAGPPVWGPRIPGIDALLRDLDLLDVCALQYRMCVEAACSFGRQLPAERYLQCRLEDMSKDLIKRILEFAELPESDEVWREFDHRFDASQPARRSAAATDQEIARILSWIEPTLRWMGYESA